MLLPTRIYINQAQSGKGSPDLVAERPTKPCIQALPEAAQPSSCGQSDTSKRVIASGYTGNPMTCKIIQPGGRLVLRNSLECSSVIEDPAKMLRS